MVGRAGEYWRPPSLWTSRWPALSELAEYARLGAWTTPGGGFRKFGVLWHRAVSLPINTVCRYIAWIVTRPGRFATVFILLFLLSQTTPGQFLLGLL